MTLSFIEANLNRSVKVPEIADAVHLSVSRLCHLFRNEIGSGVAKFVRSRKLAQAKFLLETTPLTVKEVMVRVGVNDKSHFLRDFKRIYGMSPRQSRKSVRIGDFAPPVAKPSETGQITADLATK